LFCQGGKFFRGKFDRSCNPTRPGACTTGPENIKKSFTLIFRNKTQLHRGKDVQNFDSRLALRSSCSFVFCVSFVGLCFIRGTPATSAEDTRTIGGFAEIRIPDWCLTRLYATSL